MNNYNLRYRLLLSARQATGSTAIATKSSATASQSQTYDPNISKSKYDAVRMYGVWTSVAVVNQDASVLLKGDTQISSAAERGLVVQSDSHQNIITKSTSADPSLEESKDKPKIATRSEEGQRKKKAAEEQTGSVLDKISKYAEDKENTSEGNTKGLWTKIKDVVGKAKASSSDASKKPDEANATSSNAQFVGAFTVLVDNDSSDVTIENVNGKSSVPII